MGTDAALILPSLVNSTTAVEVAEKNWRLSTRQSEPLRPQHELGFVSRGADIVATVVELWAMKCL